MREIPESWRPEAKAKARILLAELQAAGASDVRVDKEMNRISEQEWQKDRADWSAWMRMMASRRMYSTPFERVAAQRLNVNNPLRLPCTPT